MNIPSLQAHHHYSNFEVPFLQEPEAKRKWWNPCSSSFCHPPELLRLHSRSGTVFHNVVEASVYVFIVPVLERHCFCLLGSKQYCRILRVNLGSFCMKQAVRTCSHLSISIVLEEQCVDLARKVEMLEDSTTAIFIWVFSEMSFPRFDRLVLSDGGPLLIQYISDACVSSRQNDKQFFLHLKTHQRRLRGALLSCRYIGT